MVEIVCSRASAKQVDIEYAGDARPPMETRTVNKMDNTIAEISTGGAGSVDFLHDRNQSHPREPSCISLNYYQNPVRPE